MEERSVIIQLKTLQRRPEGTDAMEEKAEGSLRREEESWLLSYRESTASGLGDTRTSLRLEKDRATLVREGETAAQRVFQVGSPHLCRYATPYGEVPMEIRTLRLDVDLSELGGKVFIIYKLKLGGADVGENRLRLTITPANEG